MEATMTFSKFSLTLMVLASASLASAGQLKVSGDAEFIAVGKPGFIKLTAKEVGSRET
jgi:hypothetical protein